MRGAMLPRSCLFRANLTGSNFRGADMTDCDLRELTGNGAIFVTQDPAFPTHSVANVCMLIGVAGSAGAGDHEELQVRASGRWSDRHDRINLG